MINLLTVLLMHGLLGVMFWRLWWRDDLDKEPQPGKLAARREPASSSETSSISTGPRAD